MLFVRDAALQQLNIAQENRQDIVKVMSDTASQLPDDPQLFGLP